MKNHRKRINKSPERPSPSKLPWSALLLSQTLPGIHFCFFVFFLQLYYHHIIDWMSAPAGEQGCPAWTSSLTPWTCPAAQKSDISLQVVEVRPNLLWGEDGTGADVVHSLALHIGRPEHLLCTILKRRTNKRLWQLWTKPLNSWAVVGPHWWWPRPWWRGRKWGGARRWWRWAWWWWARRKRVK